MGYQASSFGTDGSVTTQYFDSSGTLTDTVTVAPDPSTGGTSTTIDNNITGESVSILRDYSGQILQITAGNSPDGSTANTVYFDAGQAVGATQVDVQPDGSEVMQLNLQNGSAFSVAYDQYGNLSSITDKSFDNTIESTGTTYFDTWTELPVSETQLDVQRFDDGSTLQTTTTWDPLSGYSESISSTPATDGSTSGSGGGTSGSSDSAPLAPGSTVLDTTISVDALWQPYQDYSLCGWGCGGGGGGGGGGFMTEMV